MLPLIIVEIVAFVAVIAGCVVVVSLLSLSPRKHATCGLIGAGLRMCGWYGYNGNCSDQCESYKPSDKRGFFQSVQHVILSGFEGLQTSFSRCLRCRR